MFIDGTTVYKSHLTKTEIYTDPHTKVPTDTGKFALTLVLDKKVAGQLAKDGMKLKDYEGQPMRKFTSKYTVEVYNSDRTRWTDEIPSGSEVRVEYSTKPNNLHGLIPYVKRVVIKKMGEGEADGAIFDGIADDSFPPMD